MKIKNWFIYIPVVVLFLIATSFTLFNYSKQNNIESLLPPFPPIVASKSYPYLKTELKLLTNKKKYTLNMSQKKVLAFYKDIEVDAYDNSSSLFRWTFTLSKPELTRILNSNLSYLFKKTPKEVFVLENNSWVNKETMEDMPLGDLKEIKITSHGPSTVVNGFLIVGTKNTFFLKNRYSITILFADKNYEITSLMNGKKLFSSPKILPSPFFSFEKNKKDDSYTFYGGGYGHGVGLSQFGAQAQANKYNKTHKEILSYYFPGTDLGKTQYEFIRVGITNGKRGLNHSDLVLSSNGNISFDYNEGSLNFNPNSKIEIRLSNNKLQIVKNNKVIATTKNKIKVSSSKLLTINSLDKEQIPNAHPNYRGTFEISMNTNKSAMRVINRLSIENYLRQVLPSEMDSSKGLEPLKAQAIAARTFAINQIVTNKSAIADFHLDDTTNNQVYNASKENKLSDRAVSETEGLVLKYNGSIATVQYYSVSPGISCSAEEAW